MDFFRREFRFLHGIVVSHWDSFILTDFTWVPVISAEKMKIQAIFDPFLTHFRALNRRFQDIFIIAGNPKVTKITIFSQKCYNNHRFLSYNLLVKRFLKFSLKKLLKLQFYKISQKRWKSSGEGENGVNGENIYFHYRGLGTIIDLFLLPIETRDGVA